MADGFLVFLSVLRGTNMMISMFTYIFLHFFVFPFYVHVFRKNRKQDRQEHHAMFLIAFDMLSTPILIQTSYLFGNRRNLEMMKENMSIRNYLKLSCICCSRNFEAKIHPNVKLSYMISTVAQ
ncbi:hypothetical protein CAEBREN_14206 [Caenorhabditis brenneri]|uniref:Uncharacterized protein n=1 Tax=Caenorhabditis brenneri TaxID=135651 RepID=G0NTL7_CAEBE|nr:hypothetical protein CAEBREN_14206 [Caenorhabditis brenneri]